MTRTRSRVSLLFLAFSFMCTAHVVAVDVLNVPFGTLILEKGEARTYSDWHDIVIVRTHPKVIRQASLFNLYETTISLLEQLENRPQEHVTDSDILRSYQLRIDNLNWTASDSNRKRRWAVLEPVGALAGSLFGLTTVKQTEEIRQKVNSMIDAMGQQSQRVQGLTVAVHDLKANQQAVKQQVDKLTDSVNTIMGLMSQTETLSTNVWQNQCYITIESVLSLLESYKRKEELFERDFKLTRNLAEIGHVTEDLISTTQL